MKLNEVAAKSYSPSIKEGIIIILLKLLNLVDLGYLRDYSFSFFLFLEQPP